MIISKTTLRLLLLSTITVAQFGSSLAHATRYSQPHPPKSDKHEPKPKPSRVPNDTPGKPKPIRLPNDTPTSSIPKPPPVATPRPTGPIVVPPPTTTGPLVRGPTYFKPRVVVEHPHETITVKTIVRRPGQYQPSIGVRPPPTTTGPLVRPTPIVPKPKPDLPNKP